MEVTEYDAMGPITAYRAWSRNHIGSKVLLGSIGIGPNPWIPGMNEHAKHMGMTVSSEPDPHLAPESQCSCGIWAFKDVEDLAVLDPNTGVGLVFGEVELWGTVFEHELGYRAEVAKIKRLFQQSEALDVTEHARLYGVEVVPIDDPIVQRLREAQSRVPSLPVQAAGPFTVSTSVNWGMPILQTQMVSISGQWWSPTVSQPLTATATTWQFHVPSSTTWHINFDEPEKEDG